MLSMPIPQLLFISHSLPTLTTLSFTIDKSRAFHSEEDRDLWEADQKRLDCAWYSMDQGYDGGSNPFSNLSDDYTRRKEEEFEQKKKKRMSARQRQINKVCPELQFLFLSWYVWIVTAVLLVFLLSYVGSFSTQVENCECNYFFTCTIFVCRFI